MHRFTRIGYAFLVSFSLVFFGVACSNDDPTEGHGSEKFTYIPLTQQQRLVAQKVPGFSEKVFKALDEQSDCENVVFSPLSCQWCLSMLANACTGNAQEQILDVLGFNDFSLAQINDYNTLLTSEITKRDRKVKVEVANAFFRIPEIAPHVTKEYKALLSDYYCADILTSENIYSSVNKWVKNKTHGMIPRLFEENDSEFGQTVISMVNALYFKGQWTDPFDKKDTFVDKFFLTENNSKKVEYLVGNRLVDYYDYGWATSIELPFGNGSFELEIILPNESIQIKELIENLDFSQREPISWASADCKIPKFSLNPTYDLKQVLKKIGLNDIFVPGATDFSPMLNNIETDHICVVDIRQGSGISIDEDGVTASSSTAAVLGDTSTGRPLTNVNFIVNRPFLFVVKEVCTNAILLMGKVTNPLQ